MKYILLSIRPQWVAKILNGEKTIEVRIGTTLYNAINRLIKEQGKAPCLIYCTKNGGCITEGTTPNGVFYPYFPKGHSGFSGKVVAMFEASVEEIEAIPYLTDDTYGVGHNYVTKTLLESDLLEESCLNGLELYLKGCCGTALHIHNLKIFDKPKELKDFNKIKSERKANVSFSPLEPSRKVTLVGVTPLTKAPQSWCYCEVEK